ncbi:hypothetical protein HDU87_001209 [Geranomyces variabilis]|uniref:Uncharacterized protein n=1 Tax=Geranomyces variabilis TaxID=109894 RepID=A0AAD5TDQ0_9FUNG|nr:hypothetical protein HDU87_001209 [Geranomyces variabilis]
MTVFQNRICFGTRQLPSADPTIELLSAMDEYAEAGFLKLIKKYGKDKGIDGVIERAEARQILPPHSNTTLLRETINILKDLAKRPVARLINEGTERTDDIWIWRDFWDLLFLE